MEGINMDKIKTCPFCGRNKVSINRTNENACWIECDYCGANVRSTKMRKDAISLWNRRIRNPRFAKVTSEDIL